ncbi:MAG: molybdate ABC transporter substrate-binding protein [bacterium]
MKIKQASIYGILIFILVFVVSLRQCRHIKIKNKTQIKKPELILFCGAGIRPAVDSLIKAFAQLHGISIRANYAGSGRLLGQISTMHKGDLFMPGAEFYVDRAVEMNLVMESTKRIAAYFIPVIFVQKNNPKNINSIKDLTQNGLKLGFGDERSCAIGKTTIKLLKKNNVDYDTIIKNVVYKSGTVNELGVAVQLKSVDAVIVWDANARLFLHSGDIVNIPEEQNDISAIPVVVLKSAKYPEESIKFIDFITSNLGREIFIGKGYTVTYPIQTQRSSLK